MSWSTSRAGDLDSVPGFISFSLSSGVKDSKKKLPDTSVLFCPEGATAAAVFSQNKFRSVSLDIGIKKLSKKKPMKLLGVFSGNANAATGHAGGQAISQIENAWSKSFGIKPTESIFSFTGVVGIPFPVKAANSRLSLIEKAVENKKKAKGLAPFSSGILTTDTRAKKRVYTVKTARGSFKIAGCSKGAGMIYPNMATMLCYITTDLAVPQSSLQKELKSAVTGSFNRISVDGDTSTNDTVMTFASGENKLSYNSVKKEFAKALAALCSDLAKEIVRDGEGAKHFIEVKVEGAASEADAEKACRRICNSLLFKTAVFGRDPNYGRVLVALGASGAAFQKKNVKLAFGPYTIFQKEKVNPKAIPKVQKYLGNRDIDVILHLGAGKSTCTMWTCDLTYEYVRINAEYTT